MTFYQNAKNGPSVCQGPQMIYPCPDDGLTNLPKADFVIIRDSHGGWAFANLSYTDPAVVNDNNPNRRRPQLDMYDSSNGYDPNTLSATYSAKFLRNFLDGQSKRYNDHISLALDRLAKIEQIPATIPTMSRLSYLGPTARRDLAARSQASGTDTQAL